MSGAGELAIAQTVEVTHLFAKDAKRWVTLSSVVQFW